MQIVRVTQGGFDTDVSLGARRRRPRLGSGLHAGAEMEHRIGYSRVMNRFDPTKAHAVPRSVALRDELYAPHGVTGESIRVVGG
jgi:hypothetical protein